MKFIIDKNEISFLYKKSSIHTFIIIFIILSICLAIIFFNNILINFFNPLNDILYNLIIYTINIIFLLLLSCLIIGCLKYFYNINSDLNKNIDNIFFYYKTKKSFIRFINFFPLLFIRLSIYITISSLIFVVLNKYYFINNISTRMIQVFIPLYFCISILFSLYFLQRDIINTFLFISNEDISIKNIYSISKNISNIYRSDIFFSTLKILHFIILSFFIIPSFFTLPYISIYISNLTKNIFKYVIKNPS
ncbi:MAG: hypothetical protein KFW09_00205 [Oscillospiraceae bacterium]|nr:hypothetical protein [Oscillospiraceae bacterium]